MFHSVEGGWEGVGRGGEGEGREGRAGRGVVSVSLYAPGEGIFTDGGLGAWPGEFKQAEVGGDDALWNGKISSSFLSPPPPPRFAERPRVSVPHLRKQHKAQVRSGDVAVNQN